MANQIVTQAPPIPEVWSHLVELNVDFQVLICLSNKCRCAVNPGAIVRHFRDQHKVPIELRKQIERYIQSFPSSYDYLTIQLPADGLIPQPIVPVVNGFQCIECPYKTQDRSNVRKHANTEHNKQRLDDGAIYTTVRMQSWFKNGKERYWVVDEDAEPIAQSIQQDIVRDVGEESPEPDDNTDSQGSDNTVEENSGLISPSGGSYE
jgi:hypothetical protein